MTGGEEVAGRGELRGFVSGAPEAAGAADEARVAVAGAPVGVDETSETSMVEGLVGATSGALDASWAVAAAGCGDRDTSR